MKNLFYFFAAAVMMTSCTLSQEDTPQPLNNDQVYEATDASDSPSDFKESGAAGGQGTYAEGYRPSPESKKPAGLDTAPNKFETPDADLTPNQIQTELRSRRNTGTIIGNNPKIPVCPEGNCGGKKHEDKAPSLVKKQD